MNKQNKIIVGVVALVLALTIGYAIFSQSLNINGTAKAQGNLDIVFSEVGEISPHGTNKPTATITENGRKLELSEITLDYPTAYVDIPVTIVNNGTVDGILESITVENLETDDIYVSIIGIENNQVVKVYKENDDTTKVKATVRVEWLDKTDTKTESVKDIVVTLNARQLVKEVVTTSSSSDSFPVAHGSFGDNITYSYNNGVINVTGFGPMSEGKAGEAGNCSSAYDSSYCYLGAEISEKVVEQINTVSDKEKMVLETILAQFITGKTYDDMGMDESQAKQWLIGKDGPGLNEEEASHTVKVFSSVPKLKSITIDGRIDSLRNDFFKEVKIDSISIPKAVTTLNDVFDSSIINNIYLNEGLTTLSTNSLKSDGVTDIIIPSTVTTIESSAISGNNLTTIVNKTGKAFDWNGILTGTSGTTFETGTVEYNGKTITITK